MKLYIFGILTATLAATGCGDNTSKPGGPGADPNVKPPLIGMTDDTFSLTTESVTVKQSDAEATTVGIKRGTNFAQDVKVSFTDLPKGVTAEPASPVIKKSETEAKFSLKAGADAVPGEYVVKVTGHPGTGGDATNQFKLTVDKKDTFTLSMPFWTTGLKQGETKAVSISINRDKRFDQDVTLKFDGLPKGVTVEPAGAVIKHGEAEAKFSMKAADDAPLGDYVVKVTGHPTKGADASHDFKFDVAKK